MKDKYLQCERCKKIYRISGLRQCKHSAVIKVYGKNICRYCCMKCKYNKFDGTGQICTLE